MIFTDDCDDKKVMFEDEVDQVMVTVDTPSQYNCDMCGGSFNSMDQFMNHRNTYCLASKSLLDGSQMNIKFQFVNNF